MKIFFALLTSLAGALYAQPQFLDSTFDTDGMVTTPMGGTVFDVIFSIAMQSDGKIVAGGYVRSAAIQYGLSRYNTDGSLDNAFGTGGKVLTPIGGNASVSAIAIQTDGKILAAGFTSTTKSDMALVRYKTDGTLDSAFGTNGIVDLSVGTVNSGASSIAIQTDGKIVIGGTTVIGTVQNFALARFDTSGGLDNAFGTGGIVTTVFSGGASNVTSVALQADGKIVAVGGNTVAGPQSSHIALARYNTDGSLDATFGTAGETSVYQFGMTGLGAAIQTDGKIVVAGEASPNPYNFGIARFDSNGNVDNTFGTAGADTTDILGRSRDHANTVLIQPDGKIVVGGYAGQVASAPLLGFALVRYLTNGAIDPGFGNGGIISTNFGGGNNTIGSIALQSDGKIVAGGGFSSGSPGFTLARYSNASTGIRGFPHARLLKSMRLIQANGRKTSSATGKTSLKLVK